ncbi:MAG: prepilin-type N-terminal cleavage/methylation domain-containing protein [Acidobacteria bacterium]|nr:prepilin-type N-terminal cleavage/methylation domain-containing protein [Acidobacteriota bacterium]
MEWWSNGVMIHRKRRGLESQPILQPSNTPTLRWAKGFTLVELLVVVAIIALLAALLLPALGRAKENGRVAVCLSNLRQISVALQFYTDDNRGYLPPIWAIDSNGTWDKGQMCWVGNAGLAGPYGYDVFPATVRYLNVYLGGPHNVASKIPVAWCPSDTESDPPVRVVFGASYAANYMLTATAGADLAYPPIRLGEIRSLSQTITMAEIGAYFIHAPPYALPNPGWQFHPGDNRFGCLFADGHVALMKILPVVNSTPEYSWIKDG